MLLLTPSHPSDADIHLVCILIRNIVNRWFLFPSFVFPSLRDLSLSQLSIPPPFDNFSIRRLLFDIFLLLPQKMFRIAKAVSLSSSDRNRYLLRNRNNDLVVYGTRMKKAEAIGLAWTLLESKRVNRTTHFVIETQVGKPVWHGDHWDVAHFVRNRLESKEKSNPRNSDGALNESAKRLFGPWTADSMV